MIKKQGSVQLDGVLENIILKKNSFYTKTLTAIVSNTEDIVRELYVLVGQLLSCPSHELPKVNGSSFI